MNWVDEKSEEDLTEEDKWNISQQIDSAVEKDQERRLKEEEDKKK